MQRAKNRSGGFTLLEILVAFAIFAVIGLIASQLMSQTIRANEELSARGERLNEIHRAMQIMQRDIMQLAPRAIQDEYGDPKGALLIGTDGAIEFSRSGWRNPLQLPRSEAQRVAYRVQDDNLIRGYWTVMDRAQDSEPTYQTLLKDVERIEFFAVDTNDNVHPFWPMLTGANPPQASPGSQAAQTGIAGVLVRIELAPFGVIERIWEVPSVEQH